MDFYPVSLILFILVFVPGYIFIHILDYHLVKGEKSQFEKTVQGLLVSTIIWPIMMFFPYIPFVMEHRKIVIDYLKDAFITKQLNGNYETESIVNSFIFLYLIVCGYVFVLGNIWGWIRRHKTIDDWFRFFTGRDRYKTVSLRFYTEYFGSTVAVSTFDGKKYAGVLTGAPDDNNDAIIINKPFVLEGNTFMRMSANAMLLYIDKINRVEVLKQLERRGKWKKNG
jgi:hypothetical protein